MKSRRIRAEALTIGDTLVHAGRTHRVTDLATYVAPSPALVECFAIAHVEGHGPFITLWEHTSVEVAA